MLTSSKHKGLAPRLPEILQVSLYHPQPLTDPKEVRMYSRNVSFKLKAKSAAEFTRILEGGDYSLAPKTKRVRG
jgi:hypothetical protein